jgi:NADPH-dependent ferric siderophore reductase
VETSEHFPWRASASVPLQEAVFVFEALAEHLGEHLELTRKDGTIRALTPEGELVVNLRPSTIDVSIRAIDTLTVGRAMELVATHMQEFSQEQLAEISWRGNAVAAKHARCFRMVTVTGVVDLSPNIRRLTFRGEELQPFAQGLHVQLFLPRVSNALLPDPDTVVQGKPIWRDLQEAPFVRTYTIRRLDVAAGTLDIDFVLHHCRSPYTDAPGAGFAAIAEVGMRVGMFGPGGRSLPPARHYVLAGDETALPMIARLLETMPAESRADCIIEIQGMADRQCLPSRADCRIRWLERDETGDDPSDLLLNQVLALNIGPDDPERFILFAAKAEASRQFRQYLRDVLHHSSRRYLCAGFW